MTEKAGRLGWGERIGYSLGDAGSSFYWKIFEFYLVFYYTDVLGISAAAVGTMLLVTRITDALTDPVAGALLRSPCSRSASRPRESESRRRRARRPTFDATSAG